MPRRSHFSGLRSALGFVGILFFTAGFNFGFGALVWVYASESFPARLRTAGASTMLTADLVGNLLISRFFLTVLQNIGGTGTFALFLGLALVSFVFVRRWRRRRGGGRWRRSASTGRTAVSGRLSTRRLRRVGVARALVSGSAAHMNGELMSAEMAEQPERLRALIARGDEIGARVRGAVPSPLHGVTLVARGSSDHAATYGRYLLEAATGKPVSLAAPSLHTLYGIEVDYRGQLVVAVSQSGAHAGDRHDAAGLRGPAAADWRSPTIRERVGGGR